MSFWLTIGILTVECRDEHNYVECTCEHKQSPASNSVRHSLTELCLPFISIWQD